MRESARRDNYLAFSGLPWAQEVRGSNPRAPTNSVLILNAKRMCTLTFVPSEDGYLAGMNRDELLTRPPALPPMILERDGMEIVCPRESSGGTWIASNSEGNLLALLNWNEIDTRFLGEKRKTRGIVNSQLIQESDPSTTASHFGLLRLEGVFPFRLIAVFRKEKVIHERRWDGAHKHTLDFPWARKHWFSSSLSDASAERERGRVCEEAAADGVVGTREWLRSLHRSHVPAPGPFRSVSTGRMQRPSVTPR